MNLPIIFSYYFSWHYSKAFRGIFVVSKNYLKFIFHFFAIGAMLATLFSPWQRIQDETKKGDDFEKMFENFVFNGIMRALGFFMRSIIIIVGLLFTLIGIFVSLAVFILWPFLPLIVVSLFVFGLRELII